MLYSILWMIPRRVNFVCRSSGTLSVKMEQTECSETSANKIHTPWNHPKDRIQHSEHGEILK